MTKDFRNKVIRKTIILLFILILICLFLSLLYAFLSKTDKVNANILIVEGWMPSSDINAAFNEFKNGNYDHIITTGMKPAFEGCIMYENGFLVFRPDNTLRSDTLTGNHLIEIDAHGSTDGENSAEFNFFINKNKVSSFIASSGKKKYIVHWKGSLSDIDSLAIQFFNDRHSEFFDRNLYVRKITIDHTIELPALNYSEYDRGNWDGRNRVKNNIDSNAGEARHLLISLGADSSSVISVPGKRVKINRTLNSALALKDWLSTSGIKITGINIVSSGSHARRTWMTYNKVLGGKYKIGIIALPEENYNSVAGYIFKTVREGVAIVYYWFLLLPY